MWIVTVAIIFEDFVKLTVIITKNTVPWLFMNQLSPKIIVDFIIMQITDFNSFVVTKGFINLEQFIIITIIMLSFIIKIKIS